MRQRLSQEGERITEGIIVDSVVLVRGDQGGEIAHLFINDFVPAMNLFKITRAIVASRFFGAPFFFRFYVTRRCNMRCRMCNVWKHADPRSEMGLEQIARVVDEIRKTGVRYVVLTGGEPFLRRDLPEIVSMFDRAGFLIRVQTNAGPQVTEEILDAVIRTSRGRLDLTVSLDTLDPEAQDHICNFKGVVESTMRVLRMAVQKLPKSMINANIVVNRLNIGEIPEIVRTLDAMRIWSNPSPINMPSPAGQDMLLQRFDKELAFSLADARLIDKTFDELVRMKEKGYRIGHSEKFLRESAHFLTTGEKKWPECEAGILYFSVFPDGSVYPCDELYPIGNALSGNFAEHYKSAEYRKKVQALHASCEGCFYGCWREASDIVHSNAMLMERFKTFFRLFARDYFAHTKPEQQSWKDLRGRT